LKFNRQDTKRRKVKTPKTFFTLEDSTPEYRQQNIATLEYRKPEYRHPKYRPNLGVDILGWSPLEVGAGRDPAQILILRGLDTPLEA